VIRTSHAAPDTVAPVSDWRQFGACRDEDPEKFYPTPGDEDGIAQAKRVCASCLVRADCLEAALADEGGRSRDGRYGVRGQMTGDERYLEYARRRKHRGKTA
jgi:WhiB family redox-sensing transcriptional regulator